MTADFGDINNLTVRIRWLIQAANSYSNLASAPYNITQLNNSLSAESSSGSQHPKKKFKDNRTATDQLVLLLVQKCCDIKYCSSLTSEEAKTIWDNYYVKKVNQRSKVVLSRCDLPLLYKCQFCAIIDPTEDRRFSRKDQLRRHYRCHLGDNTEKCPLCSYTAHRKDHMKRHIKHNHITQDYKKRQRLAERGGGNTSEIAYTFLQHALGSSPQRGQGSDYSGSDASNTSSQTLQQIQTSLQNQGFTRLPYDQNP